MAYGDGPRTVERTGRWLWKSVTTIWWKNGNSGLSVGDVVRHCADKDTTYVVTANYGGRVTAVRSVDITNPEEWEYLGEE
jgi:hypothetical protein